MAVKQKAKVGFYPHNITTEPSCLLVLNMPEIFIILRKQLLAVRFCGYFFIHVVSVNVNTIFILISYSPSMRLFYIKAEMESSLVRTTY